MPSPGPATPAREDEAAARIQRAVRSRQSWRRRMELMEQRRNTDSAAWLNTAATMIQSIWRGTRARRRLLHLNEDQEPTEPTTGELVPPSAETTTSSQRMTGVSSSNWASGSSGLPSSMTAGSASTEKTTFSEASWFEGPPGTSLKWLPKPDLRRDSLSLSRSSRLRNMLESHYSSTSVEDLAALQHFAARAIQSVWRAHAARQAMGVRREKMEITESIEELLLHERMERRLLMSEREYECTDLVLVWEEEVVRYRAAIHIQRFWRTVTAIRAREAEVRARQSKAQEQIREDAAMTLQSAWRCALARGYVTELAITRARVVVIDLAIQRDRAARTLQQVWRRHRQRRAGRRLLAALRRAKSNHRVRQLRQARRQKLQEHCMQAEYGYAVVIQRHVRGFLCRRHFQQLVRARQDQMSTRIQRLYRGYRDRHHFQQQVLVRGHTLEAVIQRESAVRIQALWRGANVRGLLAAYRADIEALVHANAARIQALARGYLTRAHLPDYRHRHIERLTHRAARRIQAVWRSHAQRQPVQQALAAQRAHRAGLLLQQQQTEAALVIQSWVRGRHDARQFRWRRLCVRGARFIQEFWRYWGPIVRARRDFQSQWLARSAALQRQFQSEAAILIQRGWRGKAARTAVQARLLQREEKRRQHDQAQLQHHAASLIQAHQRRVALRHFAEECKAKTGAAIKVQAFWRMCQAMARLAKLRVRMQLWGLEERRRGAAVTVQRIARGWLGRQKARAVRSRNAHREVCACTIQSMWRCALARDEAAALRRVRDVTALQQEVVYHIVTVQRAVRGWQARARTIPRLRQAVTACNIVLRAWRSSQARAELAWRRTQREARNEYWAMYATAQTIQRLFRGFQARRATKLHKAKLSLDRTHQRWRQQAALDIQRIARGAQVRAALRPVYDRQQQAAVVINRVMKGHLVRARLRREQQAALHARAQQRLGEVLTVFLSRKRQEQQLLRQKKKMHQIALKSLVHTEAQGRLDVARGQDAQWAAIRRSAAVDVNRIAASAPKVLSARAPMRKSKASTRKDASDDGLFLRGWMEWMEQLHIRDNRQMEQFLMREAVARRRTCNEEQREWKELLAMEDKSFQLTSIGQKLYPKSWMKQQKEDKRQFLARTNKLRKDVALAYDPKWVMDCMELDEAAKEQAWQEGRKDWESVPSTLSLLKQDAQDQVRQRQTALITQSQQSLTVQAPPAVRKGAAARLPSMAHSAAATNTAADAPHDLLRLRRLEEDLARDAADVTTVDLQGQRLTDSAVLPLLTALKRNRRVRHLILDGNLLTDATGIELGKLLHHNTSLQVLSVRGNGSITDLSAKHWVNALKSNTSLKALHCDQTQVTDSFAAHLLYMLNFASPQISSSLKKKLALPSTAGAAASGMGSALPELPSVNPLPWQQQPVC
mmetsp:Transcript_99803/g.172007  ORF Transcript_99803/g.172007 Transcript_99803/m.172007 type:complete len:1405 (-) Transcript_99803:977-5191(-)